MEALANPVQAAPMREYDLPCELDGTSWSVRENMALIFGRELMGPAEGPEEVTLGVSPVTKYIVGRLAPVKIASPDDLMDEQADDYDGYVHGGPDAARPPSQDAEEAPCDDAEPDAGADDAAQRSSLTVPSSMGLRFQVPAGLPGVDASCTWGTYAPAGHTGVFAKDGSEVKGYRRTPHDTAVRVDLASASRPGGIDLELDEDVFLHADAFAEEGGERIFVELALCNRAVHMGRVPVEAWLFQTAIEVGCAGADVFLPVHDWELDPTFAREMDGEQRRINLQYRNRLEFAIGRTCSVDWEVTPGARRATKVMTTWLPTCEVPQVQAANVAGAELDMEALAVADAAAVEADLRPVVSAYASWLAGQQAQVAGLPGHLQPTAAEAVEETRQVVDQLSEGLDYLVASPQALECFHFMNRVMADQRVQTQVAALRMAEPRLGMDEARARVEARPFPHHWRVFQISFILMQVVALMEPDCPARSGDLARAQLIFFPTGGGKTEAYLGLAAFSFAARRLAGRVASNLGPLECDGVTVLMRYSLRLLTSQQFQRAAALMCAAELERRRAPQLWGQEPFRLGLWVGSAVTPKTVDDAIAEQQASNSRGGSAHLSVLQLPQCPWCGSELGNGDVRIDPETRRVLIHCSDRTGQCPFCEGGSVPEGLPVLMTDEEIYRLAPSFVIATVDKFARLAREGQASSLFGYVGRKCDRHGYVPRLDQEGRSEYAPCAVKDGNCHPAAKGKGKPAAGPAAYVRPTNRLRPPDLIIQDELHLITGSLGTTVGLFETAVDVLCSWRTDRGTQVKPLIVASSATMRNAASQIHSLYGRDTTVFPPQVLDASDTFFSKELAPCAEHPGRRYVGVCASGVRLTQAEIQLSSLLMKSAQLLFDRAGQPADPYMTLVGYYSATRELAGMARYMQDDVTSALRRVDRRTGFHRRVGASFGRLNVGELTSRISSTQIVQTLGNMAVQFDTDCDTVQALERSKEKGFVRRGGPDPYDAVLATSMLQVGVDVPRLGLMLFVGQPKNTAEYIQASSRVGRDAARPGLVVTLGNWSRPRDLAHFEQFRAYHESFYARVEPLSVTPYSVTSLDRGVAGLLVSVARVLQANEEGAGLTPESAAGRVVATAEEDFLCAVIDGMLLPRVASACDERSVQDARSRLNNRLDTWIKIAIDTQQQGKTLVYERGKPEETAPLLRSAEAVGAGEREGAFKVANSMREVQPEVNVLVSPDPARLRFKMAGEPEWQACACDQTQPESEADDAQ